MERHGTKTPLGELKIRTSRTPGSTRAILRFAFLLPLFLAHSAPAAAATPAGESTANEPMLLPADHTSGVVLVAPAPLSGYNPANMLRLKPAHPEEKHPYVRPAAGSGRVVPQIEYLPGPTIKDIGSV
jgi:hypothetical protein